MTRVRTVLILVDGDYSLFIYPHLSLLGIEITDSLMWTVIVPVTHKAIVNWKHPSLADVRSMRHLNLDVY
ncbi:MAG: hypothetical protein ABSG74_02075 [Candidatus Bathyarchaeia archaeon]